MMLMRMTLRKRQGSYNQLDLSKTILKFYIRHVFHLARIARHSSRIFLSIHPFCITLFHYQFSDVFLFFRYDTLSLAYFGSYILDGYYQDMQF